MSEDNQHESSKPIQDTDVPALPPKERFKRPKMASPYGKPPKDGEAVSVAPVADETDPLEEARRTLQQHLEYKIACATAEIQAVLAKYELVLEVSPASVFLRAK